MALAPLRRRVAAAPIPATSGSTLWVDASNWTGELTDEGCADLKAAGIVGVIIQAITGLDGRTFAVQQLEACRRNGLRIQGYIWAYPRATWESLISRLAMFDGFALEAIWVDVEQAELFTDDVDLSLAVCDEYLGSGRRAGVYGARWFWAQQGWLGLTKWADRPLWNADYNHTPVVGAGFVPFGGWTKPTISQFEGTTSIGNVHQIDMDVMS